MNKIEKHSELKAGRVYNRVYVGDNEAYARINGKITFLVLKTSPVLKVVELFDQFGDPLQNDLRSGVITISDQSAAFKDFDLYEPSGEAEWFKKSMIAPSLHEAIRGGLIKLVDAKRYADWQGTCPFVAHCGGGPNYGLEAVTTHFCMEDQIDGQPLLQSVFIVWKTWDALRADFKVAGISRVRT